MANHDPYEIKVRLARLDMTVNELCDKMRDNGCDVFRQALARARRNEVKTPRDWEILYAADQALKQLEGGA